MTRIPEIKSKQELSGEHQSVYDEIFASRGKMSHPFTYLLHCPELARRVAHLGAYVLFDSALSDAERELAICTTAQEHGCIQEWVGHSKRARAAGASEAALRAIESKGDLDGIDPAEALIVRYARELARDCRLSDATFDAAKARYGNSGMLELSTLIGYYAMLAVIFGTAV